MEEKCFHTYLWFENFFRNLKQSYSEPCRPTIRPGVSKIFDLENFWMEEKGFHTYLWFEKFFESLQQSYSKACRPTLRPGVSKIIDLEFFRVDREKKIVKHSLVLGLREIPRSYMPLQCVSRNT